MQRYVQNLLPKRGGFVLLVLSIFAQLFAADASAQSFVGHYCWNFTVTDTTTNTPIPTTFSSQTDITSLGGTSYTVVGAATDPGDNPMTFSGFGYIRDGKLYMDMIGSQVHLSGGWRDTSSIHATIDTATFTGTFFDIGVDFNVITRARDSSRYSAGTIALAASCP